MSEPYMSEIRMVAFNFAPRNWVQCDGAVLPIDQHQSLYSLLGTTYGGDGRTSFALPDLRGRTPIHAHSSSGYTLGAKGGENTHALTAAEIPSHTHALKGTTATHNTGEPSSATLMGEGQNNSWAAPDSSKTVTMDSRSLSSVGGTGHQNMQPYLGVNFVIAVTGIFPSRN